MIVASVIVIVTLDAGIVGSEGTWLFRLVAGHAVHFDVSRGIPHGNASHLWDQRGKVWKCQSHTVFPLLEFVNVITVAARAGFAGSPFVRTGLI